MDTASTLLLINPHAGTISKEGMEAMVAARLGFMPRVAFTTGRGSAAALTRQAIADGVSAVIAAGGDGTVNETASALLGSGVALGIIPCGSGNGLARHLDIPMIAEEAVDIIAVGHIDRCDSGVADDRPFFCTFGVGFDAAVSAKFDKKQRRGRLTYMRQTFLEYLRYHPERYTIRAAGKIVSDKAFLVAVCNASQYGNNAYIAPHASMVDGLLDVTIVHSGSPLSTALVGMDLLTGMIEHNMLIETFTASELSIERSSPGPAHLDGEPRELGSHIDIRCNPGSLAIFTPERQAPTFRPIITPMRALMRDIQYAIRQIF
ncbi:MAG: diacylglycerol kinase family lipid kinase [Pseudoflavonifractor sp.]|nr:diacylglycerol kinase family lipid kinase [Alloprevotella sp.]MCM1117615.1 diacylglycerol kinase family lipid kinase [Pseudoflavonifractor sp.]